MIIPAAIAIPIAPLYLFTGSEFWITVGFGLQGAFGLRRPDAGRNRCRGRVVVSLLLSPETKGTVLVAELQVA